MRTTCKQKRQRRELLLTIVGFILTAPMLVAIAAVAGYHLAN